jgi:hypothetical protein
MYRIQAHNVTKNYTFIYMCESMTEREALIKELLASGNYTQASITWEHGRFFSC